MVDRAPEPQAGVSRCIPQVLGVSLVPDAMCWPSGGESQRPLEGSPCGNGSVEEVGGRKPRDRLELHEPGLCPLTAAGVCRPGERPAGLWCLRGAAERQIPSWDRDTPGARGGGEDTCPFHAHWKLEQCVGLGTKDIILGERTCCSALRLKFLTRSLFLLIRC